MLKVLPENISNLIAAGEVVSRPASVIKELVENAIDAGAKEVSVIVTDSGRTMIQVIDDGCGMTREEAQLCFERHATSKIATAEDLEKIMTFGFRGEALASIAAVAEVTLKTRQADAEMGTKVTISASRLQGVEAVNTPKGTNFEIRNLFYNVPARRKFLKSDASEMKQIIAEFLRVALTRTDVALKLISNGKEIYGLRREANHKQRIKDIFGAAVTNTLSEIKAETSVVNVRGYIGAPEEARKSSGMQYFFVNGRYFKSPYLHKAVCNPYAKLIPEGYLPTYFIFLETEPDKVDVNIHPAKTEVKFEDENIIFEILSAAVREGLGKNSLIPMIDFDMKGAPEIPTMQSTTGRGYVAPPKIDFNPLFDPFKGESGRLEPGGFDSRGDYPGTGLQGFGDSDLQDLIPTQSHAPSYGNIFEDSSDSAQDELFVLSGKYIVTRTESGITVVNITRARERIFYERYIERVAEQQPLIQQTLFPVTLPITPQDALTLRDESEAIAKMGFDISLDGDSKVEQSWAAHECSKNPGKIEHPWAAHDCTTVTVRALPEGYAADEEGARRAVDELLATLADEAESDNFREAAAQRMARSAALSRKEPLTHTAALDLLEILYGCRCPQTTSDGRKIITTITLEELDKRI